MMIMMYGISLFLVLIILGPPPSSLVVSSFSILYSFPNSSLWRDRYYDPTTQNPSNTKTRGGNNQKQTRDYYQVLGVEKTAKNPEIKAAFHRLVKLYHPGTYRHYRSFSRDIEPPTTKRHHRTTHIEF